MLAGLFALLWSVLGLSAMGAGIWGGAIGFLSLICSVIGAIIGVFIGGVIMLVISAICGGNNDFEANVRVSASLMVLYPINAFLAFLCNQPYPGWSFWPGVSLYGIYLIYEAVIQALKGKESSMKIVLVVLAVIVMLGFFQGRRASSKLMDFTEMYEEQMVD